LTGVLTPRTTSTSASIRVDSVVSVGQSCSNTCSLQPPGTRSVRMHNQHEIPGSEGGTPGAPRPQ
jgi:hypothetical protein